jgi:hypothetical protein
MPPTRDPRFFEQCFEKPPEIGRIAASMGLGFDTLFDALM